MSAFIVSTATMQAVCYAAACAAQSGAIYPATLEGKTKHDLTCMGNMLPRDAALTSLGTELFALNHWAVGERYEDRAGSFGGVPDFMFRLQSNLINLPPAALAKQVHCLRYQCSEGDCDNNPSYKMLQRLERAVDAWAVKASPHYDAAPWGVEDAGNRVVSLTSLCR